MKWPLELEKENDNDNEINNTCMVHSLGIRKNILINFMITVDISLKILDTLSYFRFGITLRFTTYTLYTYVMCP